MKSYLGEELVKVEDTPFKEYSKQDWIMYFVDSYGGIDGAHHKDWVLDQVVRIIYDAPITIKLAKWSNGCTEYRVGLGEPSKTYAEYLKEIEDDGYEYNFGIAP